MRLNRERLRPRRSVLALPWRWMGGGERLSLFGEEKKDGGSGGGGMRGELGFVWSDGGSEGARLVEMDGAREGVLEGVCGCSSCTRESEDPERGGGAGEACRVG